MKYPSLSAAVTHELATLMTENPSVDVVSRVSWVGDGLEMELNDLEALSSKLRARWEEFCESDDGDDKDLFEGEVSGALHSMLSPEAVDLLDDPGFWRFLTLAYFWWLVTWREPAAFKTLDYTAYRKYIDGTNPTECVLLRAYLRGAITQRGDKYTLASAIPLGADFWRSHVLRVRTGSAPVIAQEFAAEQESERMPTSVLRPYARRLNRVWTNVVLHTYDRREARALIKELRSAGEPDPNRIDDAAHD